MFLELVIGHVPCIAYAYRVAWKKKDIYGVHLIV